MHAQPCSHLVLVSNSHFRLFTMCLQAFTEDQWLYFPLGVVIVLFGALILGITPNSEVTQDKDKEPMEGMPAGEPAVEGSYVQLEEAA